eukprot:11580740-Karenia_brevis.AAC.1
MHPTKNRDKIHCVEADIKVIQETRLDAPKQINVKNYLHEIGSDASWGLPVSHRIGRSHGSQTTGCGGVGVVVNLGTPIVDVPIDHECVLQQMLIEEGRYQHVMIPYAQGNEHIHIHNYYAPQGHRDKKNCACRTILHRMNAYGDVP